MSDPASASPAGRDVLFAGATGLVGGLAMPALLERAAVEGFDVWTPARRETGLRHPRLHGIRCELLNDKGFGYVRQWLEQGHAQLGVFACSLGTTLKQAGSRNAFSAVDHDLVLRLAELAKARGARQAVVVSSAGAEPKASGFYLRVKGQMERDIRAVGFERVDFLRPGLLLGARDERRWSEGIGQRLMPWFNPLLQGGWQRYRAIPAPWVAEALVSLVGRAEPGVFVHHYPQLDAMRSSLTLPRGPR